MLWVKCQDAVQILRDLNPEDSQIRVLRITLHFTHKYDTKCNKQYTMYIYTYIQAYIYIYVYIQTHSYIPVRFLFPTDQVIEILWDLLSCVFPPLCTSLTHFKSCGSAVAECVEALWQNVWKHFDWSLQTAVLHYTILLNSFIIPYNFTATRCKTHRKAKEIPR